MDKRNQNDSLTWQSLARVVASVQERDSNILILHYKSNMSIRSLAGIFDLGETEVARIITTFAEQFSNKDNLNNVVECLIKMKKHANNRYDEDAAEPLSHKDKEIAELTRRLKDSEIKAEAYLEMIKAAEEYFRIPIRKKFGAK